jgi:hypothetical protein
VHALALLVSTPALLAHAQQAVVPPDPPAAGAQAQPSPAAPLAPGADQPKWIDPEDGWFDLSRFLEHPAGFLPLVVPVTEPALGYGAVLGALFLDPREEAGSVGWARPNMTVLGGLATEDGSDGLFAANSSLWNGGDLQTLIGVGNFGLELSLYGSGAGGTPASEGLDYHLEMDGAVAEVRQRLGDSEFWGGLRFAYARSTVEFADPPQGAVDHSDDGVTVAGPALTLRYDSLDNVLTPTQGTLCDTNVSLFDDFFGGSRDFQLFQEVLIHHWPLGERWFLGARAQFDASFGDTPFYAHPYIQLRGVPALRYQGEQVLSAEAELRWQFHPRFGLVGFGGAGAAWTSVEGFEQQQEAWSGGLGGRYLVSRTFGLLAGLDVARGPEDWAIYVQVGNAWIRP